MKPTRKAEISAYLEELQKRLSAVQKASKKYEGIANDAAQLQQEIEKLGQPNYKDDEKITRLAVTQLKVTSCEAALRKQRTKVAEEVAELAPRIDKGGYYASEILLEVYANRLETITSCLLPFSSTRQSAEQAAKNTDACHGAWYAAVSYNRLGSTTPLYAEFYMGQSLDVTEFLEAHGTKILAHAEKIERVLVEAFSKSPDLMQFLPFASAAVSAEADGVDAEESDAQPALVQSQETSTEQPQVT